MTTQMELADGRILDYLVNGDTSGKTPLVYIHGTPGGKPPLPSLAKACESRGLPLVTFSRAGYGESTRRKGRKLVDDVEDIKALLSHLGYERCYVGGWSGGGAPAVACAARLPGCIATFVVAGCAPYGVKDFDWAAGMGQDNLDELAYALKGESALYEYTEQQRPGMISATPEGLAEEMASLLPEVDKKAMLENDEMGKYVAATMQEGLKHNTYGWVDDTFATMAPWGCELDEVKCPIFLYHGSVDLMVPYAHGQYLAEHLPQQYVKTHFLEGHGHISIFLGRIESMLDELLSVSV